MNLWLIFQKKHCPFCGNQSAIKWGKQNNKQRFLCKNCNKLFIWTNQGASNNQKLKTFKKWVLNRRTLEDLSGSTNQSISSLQRLFRQFLDNPPTPQIKGNNKCHLIIDGTYFSDICLLDYLDDGLKYLQYYSLVKRECYESYLIDLKLLKQSGLNVISITSDGQKGLFKAVNEVFPNIIHQRCIIHIQRMSLIYLTRFPKTEAGIELKKLVIHLHEINNYDRKDVWIKLFNDWCKKYYDFLQEKSESITGRKWYTHKLLRRTKSLIKNALPNMFYYLDNPNIPKSTNALESRFSYLKNNINIHRGLSKKHRNSFIMWYNYFKSQ